MFSQFGLSIKMLFLTAMLALAVWLFSDTYQTRELKTIFHAKLSERFSRQAQEHRTLFDRQVKIYSQAAKLLVKSVPMHIYFEHDGHDIMARNKIIFHEDTPPWLPDHSVLRKFVLPRYAMLLDKNNKTKEVYYWNGVKPSAEMLSPSHLLLQLSENQSYLTTLSGQPYLITSEPITIDNKKLGTLLLTSPIDSEFLIESQAMATTNHTIALLSEDGETILVSSKPDLVPQGVNISALNNIYQTIGEGFFDYGSSDLVIKFVSFLPLAEVQALTQTVLIKARHLRSIATAVYAIVFMLIIYYLTRRLLVMTKRVIDFSEHMAIQQPEINTKDELKILEERFKLLASAIKNETKALEYQAYHDPLTDLPNRKMLNERLQSVLIKSNINISTHILIISDLNHFKEINDTLGHHIGDLVLQQAAERLYNTVRRSDTVARLGGDEFGILLPDTNLEQATIIAEEINDVFHIPFVAEGHNLNVGISIGIVESPMHGDDVNILVQRADIAMYDAKRNNKGFAIYDSHQDPHNISRLQLMSELRTAIDDEDLELHYQSKLDIKTGKIIGAEALLRWNHPERGMIQPDDFIPLAVQTGLIKPLTIFVIKNALKQCSIWRQMGFNLSVSINIAVQCLHDNMLTLTLRKYFKKYHLPPHCCTLELTESDIMVDPIRAKAILQEINFIGADISIDDFGTGYSSLAYLKQLPVKELKIDRSFVMEMVSDENDKVIVRTIIDLSHNLGLAVVAEGVESQTALSLLNTLGCDTAQGYYIDKPMSASKFIDNLNHYRLSFSLLATNLRRINKPSASNNRHPGLPDNIIKT